MKAADAVAAIPYARYLDIRLETSGEGLICVMPFCADIVGNVVLPAIHGGVVGAFLELTALLHLVELAGEERVARPINFSIDYLRSAGPRDTRGRAEIVKHGRRIANVRVVAWQDDPARPVATGVGNFLL
ncbi:MAG TPA: PaaI family thioesterase [Candidatus Limnocylindrales bacterium]|nr:PaaI family thioesterase [Candidatus Limnocylindrales bacterium]